MMSSDTDHLNNESFQLESRTKENVLNYELLNLLIKILTLSLREIRSKSSPPEANSITMKMSDGVSINS